MSRTCEKCIHYDVCRYPLECRANPDTCWKYEEQRPHGEWIPCSERLPKEHICDDGYVEPSDFVLVFSDHGNYGVSRYWGNRGTKKENPWRFPDWMDLRWDEQKVIAWLPLPEPYKKEGEEKCSE